MESEGEIYYRKLWKCLLKAIWNMDKKGCHADEIIVHLGKSIESCHTYYDSIHEAWCDYFLKEGEKK